MHIGSRKRQAVIHVQVGTDHVAVAEQGATGPPGNRGRVDNDNPVVFLNFRRL